MTNYIAYNGWTNYETWAVKLWIDNEEPSYIYWRDCAKQAWDKAEDGYPLSYFNKTENAQTTIANVLKDEIEEANPLTDQASMFSDLMNAALSEVNWYEIATSLIEDAKEG